MEQILDTTEINQNREYAGFWIRTGAYLIDGILLGIVQAIISFAMYQDYSFTEPRPALTIINLVIGVIYFAAMESSEKQATLGKMAVGIRVGDENGNRITLGNAIGRYFAKILSALILCIGFLMVAWDKRKQGLHDKIASTIVYGSRD